MIEINESTLTVTRSSEIIIGFLLFSNGTFETVPFETGTDHAIKSCLPKGTYIIKEYDALANVYDLGEAVIEV
jgi:hypothetical protein